MPTIAVLGAGGKTGQECCKCLVKEGHTVRAVMRSPYTYKDTFAAVSSAGPGSVTLVAGDVTAPASLADAVRGCDGGVIFAASGATYFSAKEVDYQGVVNTIEAVRGSGAGGPVVLVTSCLVTPKNRFHPIRILLNNARWSLMDYKYKGEEALRSSGLPYTIVRPGGLTNKPAGQSKLRALQGDTGSGMVSRADVAAVCVAALTNPAASRVTLELVADTKAAAVEPLSEQLKGLFAGLKPDEPAAAAPRSS